MKNCFKCGEAKPLDQFYRHKQMKDGHLNKCKECAKRDVRLHRRENESVRDYDKRRYHENAERRKRTAENAKKWNQKNPQGYKAHYLVSNAIRDNRLKKNHALAAEKRKSMPTTKTTISRLMLCGFVSNATSGTTMEIKHSDW